MIDMPRTIVDIPDTQLRDLDALCESVGISRAEAVRRAIAHFLRNGDDHGEGFGLWRAEHAHGDQVRRLLEERW
jgi:metal-responsive CopG/Arc/MetJ family transcriptional regulator